MATGFAAAARRTAAALVILAIAAPAGAQYRAGQSWPPVTIPPAPNAASSVAAGQTSRIPPAAPSLLPAHIQILHDVQGTGIVMYGALAGKADSALAVLSGIFAYSHAFDPDRTVQLALADKADRRVQALFTGSAQGSPVIGIAVVALGDKGGDVSVFYDYAAAFATSFPRMRQALTQSGGVATVPLAPLSLADGSKIGVPQGWRVVGQGTASVDLLGPLGEFISLGAATPVYSRAGGYGVQAPCCDPVKSLQAVYPQIAAAEQHLGLPAQFLTGIADSQSTVASAGGESSFVVADLSAGGRPYNYFALVQAVAGFSDPWTFTLSGVMAPQPLFAPELPTLLRIWASHTANPPGFADRLQQAAQSMDATAQILQAAITARETADYNASEAWGPVIRGIKAGDGRYRLDDTFAGPLADRLSKDSGRAWRVVPSSELN